MVGSRAGTMSERSHNIKNTTWSLLVGPEVNGFNPKANK